MKKLCSLAAAAVAAVLTLFAFAPVASAHVSPVDPTAPAGGYTTVELQVPHGCDGQATNVVSVQLRDDISSVTAQALPGWEVSYDRKPLDEPIELHGEQVTEYVASVTWTATGEPLADGQFLRYGISMKTPDLAGERLLLPTVQTCVDGSESAWIEEDPEAEHPAPAVELVASEGDRHGDAGDDAEPVASADGETASATDAESEDESDTVARVLAAVAIVVGLVAAGLSLRRRSA